MLIIILIAQWHDLKELVTLYRVESLKVSVVLSEMNLSVSFVYIRVSFVCSSHVTRLNKQWRNNFRSFPNIGFVSALQRKAKI